ncbi:MAG: hypothetical protein K0U17_08345 [Betaproteobacteria bacterium]|nr:hypothetical protein [Betaproteobacteria bacterium]
MTKVNSFPPFVGDDYSGKYVCKGHNANVGDYEMFVILKLNTITRHDIYGIYDFSTESNNQATYTGHLLAKGRQFSMTFKLLNFKNNALSTGMGLFKKACQNQWFFQQTYYEPDGSGGNFGNDKCTMRRLEKTVQKPKQEHKNDSNK